MISKIGSRTPLSHLQKRLLVQGRELRGVCVCVCVCVCVRAFVCLCVCVCVLCNEHNCSMHWLFYSLRRQALDKKILKQTSEVRTELVWSNVHYIIIVITLQAVHLLKMAKMVEQTLGKREHVLENLQAVLVQIQMAETDTKVLLPSASVYWIPACCVCHRSWRHTRMEQLLWGPWERRHQPKRLRRSWMSCRKSVILLYIGYDTHSMLNLYLIIAYRGRCTGDTNFGRRYDHTAMHTHHTG